MANFHLFDVTVDIRKKHPIENESQVCHYQENNVVLWKISQIQCVEQEWKVQKNHVYEARKDFSPPRIKDLTLKLNLPGDQERSCNIFELVALNIIDTNFWPAIAPNSQLL